MNQKIRIQANKTACKRTKNRLKENGAVFELVEKSAAVTCFGGEAGVLVKSVDTEWLGWFPEIEILITNL